MPQRYLCGVVLKNVEEIWLSANYAVIYLKVRINKENFPKVWKLHTLTKKVCCGKIMSTEVKAAIYGLADKQKGNLDRVIKHGKTS